MSLKQDKSRNKFLSGIWREEGVQTKRNLDFYLKAKNKQQHFDDHLHHLPQRNPKMDYFHIVLALLATALIHQTNFQGEEQAIMTYDYLLQLREN